MGIAFIIAIVAAFYAYTACRAGALADQAAEQIARQLPDGHGAVPPDVQTPFHSTSIVDGVQRNHG